MFKIFQQDYAHMTTPSVQICYICKDQTIAHLEPDCITGCSYLLMRVVLLSILASLLHCDAFSSCFAGVLQVLVE